MRPGISKPALVSTDGRYQSSIEVLLDVYIHGDHMR